MWPTIDRARRRLGRGRSATTPGLDPAIEDFVIILGVTELDQLRSALERLLGDTVERPDTPDCIEPALALLLGRRGVSGEPRVLRRPAGLSTPESWEIHLDGVDRATAMAVRAASRTGVFAP